MTAGLSQDPFTATFSSTPTGHLAGSPPSRSGFVRWLTSKRTPTVMEGILRQSDRGT